MPHFDSFHEHAEPEPGLEGVGGAEEGFRGSTPPLFATDEAAARFYLDQRLAPRGMEEFRGIVAPEEPSVMSGLVPLDEQLSPVTGNRVIRFRQTHRGIPVFGSRVVVEIGASQEFVSADVKTGRVEGDAVAKLSPAEAVATLAEAVDLDPGFVPPAAPKLVFFGVDDEHFALSYLIGDVPAEPPGGDDGGVPEDHPDVAMESSLPESYDYLVDAHTGEILFSYPAGLTLDVASLCRGVDDLGVQHEFNGRLTPDGFEMLDPDRRLTTHDNQYAILAGALPPLVTSPGADWQENNRAAVSAHVNATRVHDFYESVLHRQGIDGRGLGVVSVVNCITTGLKAPPEWVNAQWRPKEARMVYGQRRRDDGTYQTLATFLDVIAHELTHGVTAHTAMLVYAGEPGALNESMSDIFGVIINNWYRVGEHGTVLNWSWEIGPGLKEGGEPLRDASRPSRRGLPEHMSDYRQLPSVVDHGGVHINSGIHTLAAVKLLQSTDEQGASHFRPREIAGLYYSTLQRLTAQATFAETRNMLLDVVATRYAGFPDEAQVKRAAVEAAYDAVGVGP